MEKIKFEVSMAEIKKDISHIREALVRNDEDHENIMTSVKDKFSEIKELFEGTDKKYASKWVEKVAMAMVVTTLLAVLGAVLSLVFIN